ncbi:MAG: DUF11 domain-containing protein [Chloroflexi bacterium CFX6]|nr:DUF11 domain-containing protein [Chloroflexi bacterium CFX6]
MRVKMFYDPADPDSPFINRRNVTLQVPTRTPRVAIEKRLVSAGTAMVGAEVAFEVVVKNTGNTRLTDVDVTDTFDTAHLDFLSSVPAPTSVNEGTGTVTWDNIEGNAPGGSFEPGESIVLTVKFTATTVTLANTPARNAARVAADGGQVTAGPASATVIVTNPPTPALRITKALTTDNPTTVGSLVVFEVKVFNVGNVPLTDVDVSDAYLTAFLDFTSSVPAPTTVNEAAGLLTWDNVETHAPGGTFDPGEAVTLTVTFTAVAPTPDPDRARNSARATALGGTVVVGPETAEVEINAAPAPSIQVTKQLTTADPAEVGQTVKFEIRVTNNGNMALTDVDVGDTYDTAYLDFVTASPAQTSFNEPAGTIAWSNIEGNAPGGSFDPGETIVLTTEFVATAVTADPTRARNSARVSAQNATIQDGPAIDDVEINAVPTPRLRITKALTSPDPTAVNQTVVFRITVTNAGDTTLTNVDVSDFFETANFDFLSASPSQSAVNEAAGSVMWDNIEGNAPGGTFDPGEAIVITVNFTATAATQDPDRAQNAASASAAGGASAGPVTAQVKINAAAAPALRVQKRLVTVDPATVGDVVRFEVTVTNAGNTTLTDVDASDAYETEFLDFVSANPVQTTAIDQPAGIITWQNIESHASGGTFDPGDSIVLTVNFTAIAVTQDPARADNAAGATANNSSVQAQPVMASVEINAAATLPGTPLNASCARLVSNPLAIDVGWTDNSTFETVFEVESSVNGSPFAPIASVPSTTQAGTGTGYSYTTPNLVANASFQFRVRARNVGTGQVSSYATSSVCSTGQPAAGVLGCVEGKVFAQGRSSHAGAAIYLGDAPVAVTDADGSFEVCGVPEGAYTMAAAGVCSLKAQATGVTVEGGQTVSLNDMALAGGDVNDDEEVDLFDLVRIGADYRSQPPNDPAADCTQDGAVNLFDLVLVGSNYRKTGPLPWTTKGTVSEADTAPAPASIDWDRLRLAARGDAGGAPLGLDAVLTDDGNLEVRVTARRMEALYGADFTMGYDPERLKVVDALTSVPGVQIQPGEAWGPAPFIPLNDVDRQASEIRFAASLLKPAPPLSGDVVIATVTFEVLGADPAGAFALTSVKLSDPLAGRIAVTWRGADIAPELEPGALTERIYLPVAHRAATGGRNR